MTIKLTHNPSQDDKQNAARKLLIEEINDVIASMDHMTTADMTRIAAAIQAATLFERFDDKRARDLRDYSSRLAQ